jgi:hypothetical protein
MTSGLIFANCPGIISRKNNHATQQKKDLSVSDPLCGFYDVLFHRWVVNIRNRDEGFPEIHSVLPLHRNHLFLLHGSDNEPKPEKDKTVKLSSSSGLTVFLLYEINQEFDIKNPAPQLYNGCHSKSPHLQIFKSPHFQIFKFSNCKRKGRHISVFRKMIVAFEAKFSNHW